MQCDLLIPNNWSGDKVVVYVGTRDKMDTKASNSTYLGEYVIE